MYLLLVRCCFAPGGGVAGIDAHSDNARAVNPFPEEQVLRQWKARSRWMAEDVHPIAAPDQELHQSSAVSEGALVEHCGWLYGEGLCNQAPTQEELACQRFSAGQIAIRLHVPAPGNVPLPLSDELSELSQELRGILLSPADEERFLQSNPQLGMLPAEGSQLTECLQRHGNPFGPVPEPDGINAQRYNEVCLLFHCNPTAMRDPCSASRQMRT
jgi:hypothetical protein